MEGKRCERRRVVRRDEVLSVMAAGNIYGGGCFLGAVAEGDDLLVACAICFDWPVALQIYSSFRKTRQILFVSLFRLIFRAL